MEIWKDIKGYEGLYQVSDLGRVRSLDRTVINSLGRRTFKKGQLFKCKPSKSSGYVRIKLSKKGIKKYFSVHRLVAEAFKPNPEGKPEVDHINSNKSDNRAVNLEWCTRSENSLRAYQTWSNTSIGEGHHLTLLTSGQVLEIVGLLDSTNMTQKQIAKKYGVSISNIKSIHRGTTWNHVTGRKDNPPPLRIEGELHPTSRKVVNCRGFVFQTQREAAKAYGMKSHKSVSEVLRGRQKSGGKYPDGEPIKWYYLDKVETEGSTF